LGRVCPHCQYSQAEVLAQSDSQPAVVALKPGSSCERLRPGTKRAVPLQTHPSCPWCCSDSKRLRRASNEPRVRSGTAQAAHTRHGRHTRARRGPRALHSSPAGPCRTARSPGPMAAAQQSRSRSLRLTLRQVPSLFELIPGPRYSLGCRHVNALWMSARQSRRQPPTAWQGVSRSMAAIGEWQSHETFLPLPILM